MLELRGELQLDEIGSPMLRQPPLLTSIEVVGQENREGRVLTRFPDCGVLFFGEGARPQLVLPQRAADRQALPELTSDSGRDPGKPPS